MTYKEFEKKWDNLFRKKSYNRPLGMVSLSIDEQAELMREAKNLQQPDVSGSLAVEYGYKSCEKGNNLEHTLIEYSKLMGVSYK